MHTIRSRREYLKLMSAAAVAGLVYGPAANAELPPETTTVRLPNTFRVVCEAPKNVADALLRSEGFTDVRYVEAGYDADTAAMTAAGELDFFTDFPPVHIRAIEAAAPIKVIGGLHSGCLELIANDRVKSIVDLKGKKIGIFTISSTPHVLVSLMTAYVGLDPVNDIHWIEHPQETAVDLFAKGKIDAFLGVPPEPQEARERKLGHTILNTTIDSPWSQHFCCMISGNAEYVSRYPIATKRMLRAILKTADLCASDPQGVARQLVDGRFTDRYDMAYEALREARFDRWREFDPEDTLRFYALRMHEVGFATASPNRLISTGTDWRFLSEIKRELKI
jgi:NitT/TauT family transport system substrate-binding protein